MGPVSADERAQPRAGGARPAATAPRSGRRSRTAANLRFRYISPPPGATSNQMDADAIDPHFVTRCRHRRSLCNEIGAARRPEVGGWAGPPIPSQKPGRPAPKGPAEGRRRSRGTSRHRRGADGDVQVRTGPPGPTDAAAQRQPPTYVPRPPPARRSGPRCRGASPRPQARALAPAARRSSPVRCSPAGPPDALARHRRRTGRSRTR